MRAQVASLIFTFRCLPDSTYETVPLLTPAASAMSWIVTMQPCPRPP
jgi:hypothetical protein